ncbi:hypothetical protein ACJJTC_003407 [Scirpophaga incertulas]
MSSRLKMLLLKKVYQNYKGNNLFPKNLMPICITYKHNENNFFIKTSIHTNDCTTGPSHKNKENKINDECNLIQTCLDKETVIENVLSDNLLINKAEPLCDKSKSKKIVIDFSSPNIAKPFHAGHLRSTIIGNFIANINKCFQNDVIKINYLGDWGTQFGLLQYGLYSENVDIDQLKDNPLKKLYEIYVRANKLAASHDDVHRQAKQYFAEIELGSTGIENWKKIRNVTITELEKIYNRLGIQFDEYHWESDYNGGAIQQLMSSLEDQKIIQTDNTGKKFAMVDDREVTVLKSDSSTLYLSRDIAALLDRYERYKFDKMLYIVDNAQTDHFAALFQIVSKVNKDCVRGCEHIKFGRIKGMSTRMGNVIFLTDILDEAKRKMYEKQQLSKNTRQSAMNEKTCETLGITAVVINDLKQRRQKDYNFVWDKVLQSEGDSGIKLQYLHCRLWSLEQNCGVTLPSVCEPKYLPEEVVGDVIVELAKFEDILYRAYLEYEASVIVNYLFRLARPVNRMFNELKVKNVPLDTAAQRLLVYHSARLVVKSGLEILGIEPLYEM